VLSTTCLLSTACVCLLYSLLQEVPLPETLGAQSRADNKAAWESVHDTEACLAQRPGPVRVIKPVLYKP
jgi:hypothetical protein